MVGLLPVAPHDGLGGRHHMVPHVLRGACKVHLLVILIEIIMIIPSIIIVITMIIKVIIIIAVIVMAI